MVTEQTTLPITGNLYLTQPPNGIIRAVGGHTKSLIDIPTGDEDPNNGVCWWCIQSYEPGTHNEPRCLGELAARNLIDLKERLNWDRIPVGRYTYRQLFDMLHDDLEYAAILNEYPLYEQGDVEAYLASALDGELPQAPDNVVFDHETLAKRKFDELGVDRFCDYLFQERESRGAMLRESHAKLYATLDKANEDDGNNPSWIPERRRNANRNYTSALERLETDFFLNTLVQMFHEHSLSYKNTLAIIRRLRLRGML